MSLNSRLFWLISLLERKRIPNSDKNRLGQQEVKRLQEPVVVNVIRVPLSCLLSRRNEVNAPGKWGVCIVALPMDGCVLKRRSRGTSKITWRQQRSVGMRGWGNMFAMWYTGKHSGMCRYGHTYTMTSKLIAGKGGDKHTGREMNKYETRQG